MLSLLVDAAHTPGSGGCRQDDLERGRPSTGATQWLIPWRAPPGAVVTHGKASVDSDGSA